MKEKFTVGVGIILVFGGCISGTWGCYIYDETFGFIVGGFLAVCLGSLFLSSLRAPDSDGLVPLCKVCGEAVAAFAEAEKEERKEGVS